MSPVEIAGSVFDEKVEEARKHSGNGVELESLHTRPIPWFAYK
jgi:hypothetical protein